MEYRADYVLPSSDDAAHEMAGHVVGRIATALRNKSQSYEGATAHSGSAVLHANHEGHLVTVVCGLDDSLKRLAVRLVVSSNAAVMQAMVIFPFVGFAVLLATWKLLGGTAGAIAGFVATKPMIVLAVAGVMTVLLGSAATQISTEFNSNDFLPSDGESLQDNEALDQALGGQTEVVTVLIEAELTDDRTLRNLLTVTEAFNDELSRPTGAASDITLSLGALFNDWITDSGDADEKYDAELVSLLGDIDQGLTLDPVGLQAVFDRLEELNPIGFDQVAVNNANGKDLTLVQFNGLTGDQDRTQAMVNDIEGLWFGDRAQITTTSADVTALEVTGAMTSGQTTSIAITIIAALIVLMIFFWVTEFKPMLGVIAVAPILLVLLWVLGTMTLLGIPYNVVTALITALSIGIGVDYTIHIIHRFTEELDHGRSLIDATTITLGTTGSALVGSALTTALAFAVLLFSPLIPFQQFGLVTGITIVFALVAAIVIVPPMLIVWAAYHEWRSNMSH